ncbi:MAG: purine-nucleoside phosphorylase [Chloracidobacterium sp.]|nr:purine-nucleoside phosphorylase [Chloracidobacterium sp.]MDW8217902.1 purine-nucleoside phosphorylase [Acidobacteriota bacterium]
MKDIYEKALEAAHFLRSKLPEIPEILVVLGSGLGAFADVLERPVTVDYRLIPHLPTSTVVGHYGRQVCGYLGDRCIAAMQGRFHFYEGYTLQQATFYLRIAKLLGIEKLILTNAAGGIDPSLKPGDLMLIEDHINLMAANPLQGLNDERFGPRFPDMTNAYDPAYRAIAQEEAARLGIPLKSGVYAALLGPSYETPAEIRMIRSFGAHAVGMSTVPETIVARHMGMRVLGISCITNSAAGILNQPINHDEVLEIGRQVTAHFVPLLKAIIARM